MIGRTVPRVGMQLPSRHQACSIANSMQHTFVCPSASTFSREAAKECRRRKKEYVKCLESRVAVLEVQNKKLIEELETLKDICSPKTD